MGSIFLAGARANSLRQDEQGDSLDHMGRSVTPGSSAAPVMDIRRFGGITRQFQVKSGVTRACPPVN
jgi:hypothetical protein